MPVLLRERPVLQLPGPAREPRGGCIRTETGRLELWPGRVPATRHPLGTSSITVSTVDNKCLYVPVLAGYIQDSILLPERWFE